MTVDTLTLAIIIISAIGAGILIALVCLSYNLYTTKAQIAVEMHNIRESLNESTVGPLCVKSIDSKMNLIEEYFIGIGKEWNKMDEVMDDFKMQLNAIEKRVESLTVALNNEEKWEHNVKSPDKVYPIAAMLDAHDKTVLKAINELWKDMDSRMTVLNNSILRSIEQNKACYELLTGKWKIGEEARKEPEIGEEMNKEPIMGEPNYFSSAVKKAVKEVSDDALNRVAVKEAEDALNRVFGVKFPEEDS